MQRFGRGSRIGSRHVGRVERRVAVQMPERLEQRTLLSAQWPGAVVGVTPGSTAAGISQGLRLVEKDGGATMVREVA